jgi:hypothetical protein
MLQVSLPKPCVGEVDGQVGHCKTSALAKLTPRVGWTLIAANCATDLVSRRRRSADILIPQISVHSFDKESTELVDGAGTGRT